MNIKKLLKKLTPKFLLNFYYYAWAFLGALACGFPSRKLIVIGVTGTSGKSTTVDLISRILEEAGHKTASISTARFKMAGVEEKNNLKMTMPGRFVIQKFLKRAILENCKYVVLEVSSEGIRQFRHKFIKFNTVVFTNLSPEHIESHGGFENYRNEKLKLFKQQKNIHVINIDDENAKYFWNLPAHQKIGFGIKSYKTARNTIAENVQTKEDGSSFKISNLEFKISLLGEFNVYNATCAICVAQNFGVSLDVCKKALEKAKAIEGRMEVVAKNPFEVIVDYAHTPEQLENVYKTLSENSKTQNPNPKLICVLGSCGGGRDKWKRPVLGELAEKYCQEIIVTNEDPYDENPLDIMKEIESGFSKNPNSKSQNPKYEMILDRKEAIKKALSLAKPNDIVIITGKGSEPLMCLENGKKISWSDKGIVLESLNSNN